ncbi:hypothetical protein OIU84_002387 [Salix udensis]|uniref:Calmodulin-binding protein n=1 Tax=Salix udensis TaxID=889485 RepID=A0AAD6K459_9ROSI|nr:hypothetical protein OIU84_002387 [Salix udensis]
MERSNSMAAPPAREKRGLDSSSGGDEGQPERKRPALASVIVEALKVDSLQRLCSSLEPVLRRVVSEEVERALAKLGPARLSGRSSPKRIEGPGGRNLQLHFRSRLSLPLFTGGKVEGEHGVGDFNNEDDDNWTQEEFESHVVKERDGKRPLLTGDLQVTLKEGVGTLGELTFTDNSSWIRSRKFRLGLKVASGCCEDVRIREAKTDAFTVKDHRGELYKKHYPPALNDEVWRLEKIGKDGSFHKRLTKAGIFSVEDFLRLVVRDPQKLRAILGSGMSNKMWDILIEHAKTCVLSGKHYIYYPEDAKNVSIVFNNIYELSGLIANGEYYSSDSLSDNQKLYVDSLVKKAYDNWEHVIEYDGKSLLDFKQNQGIVASQNDVPSSQLEFLNPYDHQVTLPTMSVPVPSEQPVMDSGPIVGGYNNDMAARFLIHSQDGNLYTPVQFDATSISLQNPMAFRVFGASNLNSYRGTEDYFSEEEIRTRSHEMLENEDMQNLLRGFNMGGQGLSSVNVTEDGYPNSSYMSYPSPNYYFGDDPSRSSGKAVVGWLKLKAALRWGIFARKKAAERRAQLVELDDS